MEKTCLFIIFICFISCISDVKTDVEMSSYTIADAKRNTFFINQYSPSVKSFKLNDTVYKIREVWSELAWVYKNKSKDMARLNYCNFLVSFNQKYVDNLKYLKDDYSFNGLGWTNEKIRFKLENIQVQKDTIKLYFLVKNDTIPVFFVKIK